MQHNYWSFMIQLKAWTYYLDIYAEKSYKWDRTINVYGAIASSTSIAGWVIWSQWSQVWALIIAISQVLTAIKIYLPFDKRLKVLRPFAEEVKSLYIRVEHDWYKVAEGELTPGEINTLLFNYHKEFNEIESKYSQEEMLLDRSGYMEEADRRANVYLKNHFIIGGV